VEIINYFHLNCIQIISRNASVTPILAFGVRGCTRISGRGVKNTYIILLQVKL